VSRVTFDPQYLGDHLQLLTTLAQHFEADSTAYVR
jgi:hypothetical protein